MPRLHEWNLTTPEGHARWCAWRQRVIAVEIGRENNARRPNSVFMRRGMDWDEVVKMWIHPRQKRADTRLRLYGRSKRAEHIRFGAAVADWCDVLDKRFNF